MARFVIFGVICVIIVWLRGTWVVFGLNVSDINLPQEHLPYYFNMFPKVAEDCKNDTTCPYKAYLNESACWGYEPGCQKEHAFQQPICPGDHRGWVKTKDDQLSTFYSQGDFGYIKNQINELKIICEPLFRDDSSLECSNNLRFCRGRNIMINLTELADRKEPLRYKMDILSPGQVGGYCRLHEQRLEKESDHLSPLQSWAPELRNFVELQQRPIENNQCDIVIEKPTFIMKLDAAVNMYHHFCDFFNLYATLHMNSTHPDAFSTDVNILIWETYTYMSSFSSAFKAFTRHPILDLKAFRGDVVCFKHVVFPLLPRMIFGLYYNTPLVHGCERSGLFKAFSQFILHRLDVSPRTAVQPISPEEEEEKDVSPVQDSRIRITLLSRDTTYRRILNEEQLLDSLKSNPDYLVQRVVYNRHLPFRKQLELTHQSDILIGMHGAGLTHLLFLPDWAVLFELYNCEDENCYKDLSRLRGIKYITWENKDKLEQQDEGHHPEGGAHAKFTNFSFDEEEFVRLVDIAADHVRNRSDYKALVNTTRVVVSLKHDEL